MANISEQTAAMAVAMAAVNTAAETGKKLTAATEAEQAAKMALDAALAAYTLKKEETAAAKLADQEAKSAAATAMAAASAALAAPAVQPRQRAAPLPDNLHLLPADTRLRVRHKGATHLADWTGRHIKDRAGKIYPSLNKFTEHITGYAINAWLKAEFYVPGANTWRVMNDFRKEGAAALTPRAWTEQEITHFCPTTINGMTLYMNRRGDVIAEDGDWMGRWDGVEIYDTPFPDDISEGQLLTA
jgi:hypothetical protein